MESGIDDLDRLELPDYLSLKFGTFAEGTQALGEVDAAIQSYVGSRSVSKMANIDSRMRTNLLSSNKPMFILLGHMISDLSEIN